MILHEDIRQLENPVLREKSQDIDLNNQKDIQNTLNKMKEILDIVSTRYDFSWAMGISAVQLGMLKKACVIWLPETGYQYFINPIITKESESENIKWEGCMSFFNKRGPVPRPDWIDVEYYNENLEKKIKNFEFDEARILYHEIDHMDGILYTDRIQDKNLILDTQTYKNLKEKGELPA